ncbi:uncharacterized protein LOC132281609 [Cornus florida]|uniref:uncharacterized protein LOC132281609 n=1 Tax=Cornus florida TaxID=4283 RepID=UPI0028A11785|nr:uncharacterized protein LOC132281609 [Cornus florida]
MIFNGDRSKTVQYLQALDEILQWTELRTSSDVQIKANGAIQIAMARLEKEFGIVLFSLTSSMDTDSSQCSNSSSSITGDTSSSLGSTSSSFGSYDYKKFNITIKNDLRSIAERMNSAGHLIKCIKMYKSVREPILDASLQGLGIQNLSINVFRRLEWEELEMKIRQWMQAYKIYVEVLFAGERRLYERIFRGLGTASNDNCFVEMINDRTTQLSKLGEAISICLSGRSWSPEKLFKILDLHKALSKNLPALDVVFQFKSLECIRIQAAAILRQLVEASRGTLKEFEISVLHEQSNFQDQRGRINTFTTFVMDYITQISSYMETLTKLIVSKPPKLKEKRISTDLLGRTLLEDHLVWIIEVLQFKLYGKSKCYEDASSAQLFMMNNVHYIVQKIDQEPNLQKMIGLNYMEKLSENFQVLVIGYMRSTWVRVIDCLRDEALNVNGSLSPGVLNCALKERLKAFNSMFEEVFHTQARWVVPSLHLRQKLCDSISEKLIPAYSSFLERFKSHIRRENHQEKCINYSVEDLKTAISNLFAGNVEMVLKFHRSNQPLVIEPPENVVSESQPAMELVLHCSPTTLGETIEGIIFSSDHSKIDKHLQTVDEIQQWTESAMILDNHSKANCAIQIVAPLENEFRIVLISLTSTICTNSSKSSTGSSSIGGSTTSYENYDYTELNVNKKDDLRSIAEKMNSAGHIGKCIELYQSVRKTFLDTSLHRLGIQKASINDIRSLEWEVLEVKIIQWIQAAKICVRIFFVSEKRLCEQIFGGLGTATDDACYAETVKNPANQLFDYGKALCICIRHGSRPEKLFKILRLHKELSVLLPELDAVFALQSLDSIQNHAVEMLPWLAEAARGILLEFEDNVLHEQSNFLDNSGTIHSLTTYVVKYITQICGYREILTKLILSKPSKLEDETSSNNLTVPDMDLAGVEGRTPLSIHLIWIIHILQFKLVGKSKCYKDASLAQLFMMNNGHHIVQKIEEDPELQQMIGDDYLEKLTENVRLAVTGYQRSTWDRIFQCFRDEGLNESWSLSSGVSKRGLKERLKSFNALFEEVHKVQATWLVPDFHLREVLLFSISDHLLPAYMSFLQLFKRHIGIEDHREKYIKYSVEDLEAAILNFFLGRPTHQHQRI